MSPEQLVRTSCWFQKARAQRNGISMTRSSSRTLAGGLAAGEDGEVLDQGRMLGNRAANGDQHDGALAIMACLQAGHGHTCHVDNGPENHE